MKTIGTAEVIATKTVRHGLTPGVTRKRKDAQTVAVPGPVKWSVSFSVPCRVVSEANRRQHWSATYRRGQEQKQAVFLAFAFTPLGSTTWRLPLWVTLTHSGRKMDTDNLARSFKAVRDEIAHLLGVDDGDERVTWRYEQEDGAAGVMVRIEGRA